MRDDSITMDWRPLLQHLQDTLPGYRFSLQYLDHNGLNQAVESGTIAFLINKDLVNQLTKELTGASPVGE